VGKLVRKYNSPAVQFPVVRSYMIIGMAGGIWLAGVALGVVWAGLPQMSALYAVLVALTCLTAGLLATNYLRQTPTGILSWDRQKWTFAAKSLSSPPIEFLPNPVIQFDFQRVVFARFFSPEGRSLNLWLVADADRLRWKKLRRALFSYQRGEPVANKKRGMSRLGIARWRPRA
jgi:hypothetical protein